MCSSYGYKAIPYILGLFSIMEMILGIVRISIFFSPKQSTTNQGTVTSESPFLSSPQAKAAFALDWIASMIPTFMGIYVAIFILLATCSLLVTCCYISNCLKDRNADSEACTNCCALLCLMCASKPNHRCVSLTCNCPWYKARPRLRFQIRIGLLGFFIFLRILAIILYASDKRLGIYGGQMAGICTGSVILVGFAMLLDLYQYRIWWHYKPDGAYKKCRCCCCRQRFHVAHKRFLPAPLCGENRDPNSLTDSPCKFTVSGNCPNLELEHIIIFHAFDFKPLRRFRPDVDKTYIGFHRTKPEYAIGIAQTGFRPSLTPPQMLGFGVYFARSFADTEGKARQAGQHFSKSIKKFFLKKYKYV